MKVWYLLEASGYTGESGVRLFKKKEAASNEYKKLVRIYKKEMGKYVDDEEYCRIFNDSAWFSGEVLPSEVDQYLEIGLKEVE
jgi:hypothetical protein